VLEQVVREFRRCAGAQPARISLAQRAKHSDALVRFASHRAGSAVHRGAHQHGHALAELVAARRRGVFESDRPRAGSADARHNLVSPCRSFRVTTRRSSASGRSRRSIRRWLTASFQGLLALRIDLWTPGSARSLVVTRKALQGDTSCAATRRPRLEDDRFFEITPRPPRGDPAPPARCHVDVRLGDRGAARWRKRNARARRCAWLVARARSRAGCAPAPLRELAHDLLEHSPRSRVVDADGNTQVIPGPGPAFLEYLADGSMASNDPAGQAAPEGATNLDCAGPRAAPRERVPPDEGRGARPRSIRRRVAAARVRIAIAEKAAAQGMGLVEARTQSIRRSRPPAARAPMQVRVTFSLRKSGRSR